MLKLETLKKTLRQLTGEGHQPQLLDGLNSSQADIGVHFDTLGNQLPQCLLHLSFDFGHTPFYLSVPGQIRWLLPDAKVRPCSFGGKQHLEQGCDGVLHPRPSHGQHA